MAKSPPIVALTALALAVAPASAVGQPQPQPQPQPQAGSGSNGFRGLWTGWNGANADSLKVERDALGRVRDDYASADGERRRALQNDGRALGERVGEIVRTGDCAEGERVARAAGDFALVKAVRDHCEALTASP